MSVPDHDEYCHQVYLIFKNTFALLKNQNVRDNLKILYRLTMDLCSKLKARHFIIISG